MTCENEYLRELLAKIQQTSKSVEMDGYDSVTPLVEELQFKCRHTKLKPYDNKVFVCECCGKLFRK